MGRVDIVADSRCSLVTSFASTWDREAVALLQTLSGAHGIHASEAGTANYRAIFTRDAVMAGVAGLLLADDTVTGGFVRTLEQLRALQGAEGQVASNFEVQEGKAPTVSFGTLAPRIDAATWYLVGVGLAARAGAIAPGEFRASAAAVVRLLDALEYNGRHLVYIPTGGNWADEYVYEGYILYDQVLRAWALQLLSTTYEQPDWRTKSQAIAAAISERYFTGERSAPEHPIASYSPVRRFQRFDLAACALLAVSGIAPQRARQALDWIDTNFLQRDALPPAFHPVIDEGDRDWEALQRYHLHGFRNAPHEYHNGGIWPIWLGWLALAEAQAGASAHLSRLRGITASKLHALDRFDFEEYLNGRSGAAGGTPRMAYTATGLVFLKLAGSDAQRALLTP